MTDLLAPDLPPSVTLADGEGGLPVLRVSTALGSGEVYLHGAHVSAWRPAGADPVIFLSREAQFRPGAAIRGGVPLCFPWFGAGRSPGLAPAHGFARTAPWRLVAVSDDAGTVRLTLALTHEDVAGAPGADRWPARFEARYAVTVGAGLTLALTVRNLGDDAVSFEEALHTYLAVADVRTTVVDGLEGARYLDKTHPGDDGSSRQHGPLTLAGETDRVYRTGAPLTVRDGARTLVITPSGAASTVVWNPWADKAAAMADLGDAEWTGMICVETANVLEDAVVLEPGATHTLSATYAVR